MVWFRERSSVLKEAKIWSSSSPLLWADTTLPFPKGMSPDMPVTGYNRKSSVDTLSKKAQIMKL